MRIGLATTLWKRPALTSVMQRYYMGLHLPGVELVFRAAWTPGDEQEHLWPRVEAVNEPLSDKWNDAVEDLRREDVAGVVIIGSDDFLTPAYLSMLPMLAEYDYVGLDSLFVLDGMQGRCVQATPLRVGAGRFLSRRALDRCAWRPYTPGCNIFLDSELDGHVDDTYYVVENWNTNAHVLDVKSGNNLHTFDHFTGICHRYGVRYEDVDARLVLMELFPDLVKLINETPIALHDGA